MSGNWPVATNITCNVPPVMKECANKFAMFYKNKHQNRNLTWLWQVGTIELKPLFVTTKQHQLVMNVFQATICMLFNDVNVLTVTEIEQKTGIPKDNLIPALLYMCKPDTKLLLKEEKKPEFKPAEKI